jgi:predicted PurR-regulated permease PerM
MTNIPRPRNSRFVTALFLLLLGGTVYLLLKLLSVYVAAIVLAGVLASLSSPLFEWVCARVRNRRRVAAGLASVLVVVLVAIPVIIVASSLTAEVFSLYQRVVAGDQPVLDKLLATVYEEGSILSRLRELGTRVGVDLSPASLREHATGVASTVASLVYERLRGAASNTFKLGLHFGLMVVVMFALFADGTRLKAYLLDLSPLPDHQEEMLVERFRSISRAVFLGNGTASLLQGFFGGLGFYMFGVGSGVLWGSAIAFFAFLPIVGATLVFVPAAIYLFLNGHIGLAVGFMLYNMAYVSLLEYGLKPRLIGEGARMSGVLVFVGILAGLSLYGILGLFYGPLILTMFLTVAEIYKAEYRDDLMALRSPWVRSDRADPEPEPQSAPDSEPVGEGPEPGG